MTLNFGYIILLPLVFLNIVFGFMDGNVSSMLGWSVAMLWICLCWSKDNYIDELENHKVGW